MALYNRRAALRTLASGAVGAVTSTLWVESLTGFARQQAHDHAASAAIAAQNWAPRALSASQNETVIVLTELIIPETDTPGARTARVNRFIDSVLAEAKPADRDAFLRGLAWIDARSQARFGKGFADAAPDDQTALLTALAAGARSAEDPIGVEFFEAIKFMTIDGYYTTEIGMRQELGDSGAMFLAQFAGCDHPEHQA